MIPVAIDFHTPASAEPAHCKNFYYDLLNFFGETFLH